jgi:hypothetical protein
MLAGFVLVAFAWSLQAPVAGHEDLRAVGVSQFAAVLISELAWPNQNLPLLIAGLALSSQRVLRTEIAMRQRDPGLHARVVTALQRGMDPETLYGQLPPGFCFWQPADAIRRFTADAELAHWLPPEIQVSVEVSWNRNPSDFLVADAAPEDPVPPGFYPQWGTWRPNGIFPHHLGRL